MIVICWLDCLFEFIKVVVLKENDFYENMEIFDKFGLIEFIKYFFYNIFGFIFKKLLDEFRFIKENLIDYLNGFSDNVQEIINKFKFCSQLEILVEYKCFYVLI